MSSRMDSLPDPNIRKTQYTIVTKNVSYGVSLTSCNFYLDKRILRNVNCEVKPGEITAVAGPSGSGKTTLLEILAGLIPPCRVSGQVVVNNRPMNIASFRRVSGYVTQEDLLFPLLTVEETLIYTLRLRQKSTYDNAKARVRKLLVVLGLSHVSGARVGGGTHRGISGGEKWRVSIGVDLVHDPAILLLDEPTSGLDSAASLQVMSMLKSMAKDHGKTIVLTIHQPGIRILELIDQVLLLDNGAVVHHSSLDLLDQRLQLVGHCVPQHVNVLEFSIEVIKTLYTDEKVNFDISTWQRRFSIPQGETMDKVLAAMFSERRRNLKHRLKSSLCQQAANKLNEANGINGLDAQEKVYTDDELLAALDLLETPENFTEHQWLVYKSNIREPQAKKLSLCGKKARKKHVHTHTTGAVSFARKKDIFFVKNKREANDVESFHICYKTKDDTYIQEATRDMMVKANRHLSSKIKELGGHEGVGIAEVENIAREVLHKLFGNEEPHCYGAGVTKSQVSKFSCDLRRMRGAVVADENRLLLEKVENQAKEIQTHKKQFETCNKELETCKKQLVSQNKKVESYSKQLDTQGLQLKNMEQKLNEVFGMLKGYPAFPNLCNVASTSATTGTCANQPSPFMGENHYSPVMEEDHYSPVMDTNHYSSVMDDPSFSF